jgi:hypothetical protein
MVDTEVDAIGTIGVNPGKGEVDPDFTARVRMALSDVFSLIGFATKDDIRAVKEDLKEDIRAGNARLDARIDKVETGLNARIDKVDAKIDAVSKDLNSKIDALGIRMWQVGAAIITTVVVVAKFFAHS